MYSIKLKGLLALLSISLLILSCQKKLGSHHSDFSLASYESRAQALKKKLSLSEMSGSVHLYAEGLNNPRGLKFGPDGNLYVAEGGLGGSNSTIGQCEQVVFPVGPYTGGTITGRISMITSDHVRHTITDQLPSTKGNEIIGGDISGVSDLDWVNGQLYALVTGAGCSHGVPTIPNGVVKVNSKGSWSLVADLSAYTKAHPVAHPEEEDFEPDGDWYSMINVRGSLYIVEANHGELVKVDLSSGMVSRVVDISASQGHIVPTVLDYRGNFFVGNLYPFPIPGGASKVMKVTPDGHLLDWITGLNTILGIAIDQNSNFYVLETTAPDNDPTTEDYPTPGAGRVVRIDPSGKIKTVIAAGLSLPTGMTMGPDGKLYVSNVGFGPEAVGGGQILQIDVHE